MVFRKKNINFSGDMNGQQLKSSRPLAEGSEFRRERDSINFVEYPGF